MTTGARLVLTSDDLIPLLSKCILLSGQRHLFAELCYLKDLRLSDTNASSQAHFNLVTFEAALMNAVQSYDLTVPSHARDAADEDEKAGVAPAAGVEGDDGPGGEGGGFGEDGASVRSGSHTSGGGTGGAEDEGRRAAGQKQAQQGKQSSRRGGGKASEEGGDEEDKETDPREIVLPEVKGRVRTTDGQAPRVGGLLSRLSQFNM